MQSRSRKRRELVTLMCDVMPVIWLRSVCLCVSPSRPSLCDAGHKWQLRQGGDGPRPVATKPPHHQEAGRTRRTSCCRTMQVTHTAELLFRHKSYPKHAHWRESYCLRRRDALRSIFDEVSVVDVMDSGDAAHLSMMKRPDLGVTFTKLHCWTLTQYSKCVFMDADTLVRNKKKCVILYFSYMANNIVFKHLKFTFLQQMTIVEMR